MLGGEKRFYSSEMHMKYHLQFNAMSKISISDTQIAFGRIRFRAETQPL